MDGMKKSYSYIALAQGVVGMRTFACWCDVCMKAIGLLAKDGVLAHPLVRVYSWLAAVRAIAREHKAYVLSRR